VIDLLAGSVPLGTPEISTQEAVLALKLGKTIRCVKCDCPPQFASDVDVDRLFRMQDGVLHTRHPRYFPPRDKWEPNIIEADTWSQNWHYRHMWVVV
jgi:hypothetical protein